MDRPLRLITASPLDHLARVLEGVLVVASQPLSLDELATAADDDPERVETALGLLRERHREGRSGIVLEHVAGGWAFRAGREAAEACGRLVERPVQRSLSQAALETLAIVAYLGPCSRPEIARIRGVAADAAADGTERIELALGLLAGRYREGRSGIVLEHVAGGYAFRASREAAEACDRLFERPIERGLSQAALETLSIVAYLGPCSRPEIARIRGVAADSAVAGLLERGLIAEAGREESPGGAVRYRTTPLFERVFGLESSAALPRLADLGDTADELRERLQSVAVGKTA